MTKDAHEVEIFNSLFDPSQYEDLSEEERALLTEGYQQAIKALRKNITPLGFSACSLEDNRYSGTDANYRSVWTRDGCMTLIWSLELNLGDIRQCQRDTLNTLLSHQSPNGHIPANVRIDNNMPDYGGVGGIGSIDSAMWLIVAMWRYAEEHNDHSLIKEHAHRLQRVMDWLGAQDVNNCGMLEIQDCADWMDLFYRSYNVLHDEVLWYRALVSYSRILNLLGEETKAKDYQSWACHVKKVVLESFWPSTINERESKAKNFAEIQFSIGNSQYLINQISPFSFSWRCDVLANLLAFLSGVTSKEQALITFRFLWGVGANDPWPIKNIYPSVLAGDPEWRDFFTVNLLNLPNHYHNGGIWPFIGSIWVRFLHKLGLKSLARQELVRLTLLCKQGIDYPWEFNEWAHGVTGRPMGKAFQAWSAAGYIQACHDLHVDPESLGNEE